MRRAHGPADDAYCFTLPPPLEAEACCGPEPRAKSVSPPVSDSAHAHDFCARAPAAPASTLTWRLDPILGTPQERAAESATATTRVYRYGALADLLHTDVDELWRQLEPKAPNAARGR